MYKKLFCYFCLTFLFGFSAIGFLAIYYSHFHDSLGVYISVGIILGMAAAVCLIAYSQEREKILRPYQVIGNEKSQKSFDS
ncbi:hypothetical protein KKC32_01115 [Patescibacteria group bacterium]|nr:hypothetical protein [Patescibacteria group bacterium]